MSWSINFIGTSENIVKALQEHSTEITGVSKEEYDEALPHIEAIVKMNYNKDYPSVIKVSANGHAQKDKYSNCNVSIGYLDGQIV